MSSYLLIKISFFVIYRWYKVCRPTKYFFTAKRAKLSCFCALVLAAILSWPSLILYGTLTLPMAGSDVMGTTCLVSDEFINTIWPLVFYTVYFACYVVLVITIVLLYSKIALRYELYIFFFFPSFCTKTNLHCLFHGKYAWYIELLTHRLKIKRPKHCTSTSCNNRIP